MSRLLKRQLVLTFAIGLWLAHWSSHVREWELQHSQFAWSSVWCYAACSHAFETQANVKALSSMDPFLPNSCKVLINESWGSPHLAGHLPFFPRLGCKHPHSLFSRMVDTPSVQHNSSAGNQYTRIYSPFRMSLRGMGQWHASFSVDQLHSSHTLSATWSMYIS